MALLAVRRNTPKPGFIGGAVALGLIGTVA